MKTKFVVAFLFFVSANHLAQASETVILQRDGFRASVNIHSSKVSIVTSNTPPTDIAVESEKELHIDTADYNFDGFTDFSVWHMDDGMGTYMAYRVFVYNRLQRSFEEVYPACGDEFINLKVDKKKKRLISTIFANNTPKICHTKLKATKK